MRFFTLYGDILSTPASLSFSMAFRRGRKPIRDAYDEHYILADPRDVGARRVVSIVEKRNPVPWPVMEFDRYINDDQWYGGPRNYYNARDSHGEGSYPGSDRRYHDENPSFRRNSPPPRNDGPYSQQCYSREDLRHQLGPRNSARGGPYFRNRGRGSGPLRESHNHYRTSPPVKRDRSPGSREAQPPVHSGSNTSNRSFSPDREKSHTHQQAQKKHKPNVSTSHTPSSTAEESAPSSASSKEKTPASVAETEEVVAASMEPKLTPEEDVKTRRSEAITAKALEIEKHYRQDCETFRTVVKMLVAKEPSLDNLLQASLDENLLEIKQRCLDDLRHFVKELDEIIAQGGDGPHHGSPNTSRTTHFKTDGGFPQQCSAYPTSSDGKQEGRKQPANTGDSAHVPLENLRQGGGKQIGNTEDSPPVPEIYRQGNLATPGHEDSTSEGTLSESTPTPAQQGSTEVLQKRLQLYRSNGEKFSDTHLLNPTVWQEITHARPGRIPERLPYLQPGSRYWELKSNSTVVSTSIPSHCKGQRKVACGVTCYIHAEGPWCEVQSQDGTRICILAAPPADRTSLPHLEQGPAELKGREGVRRGPRSRMHSAIAPYPSKHQGIQALRD